jgi:hypothetical protein
MRTSRYLRALRFALSHQANAYGFTLVVWGTGALAIWQLGKPDPGEVFALTLSVGGIAGFFLAAFIASSVSQFLLGIEVAAALAPRGQRSKR